MKTAAVFVAVLAVLLLGVIAYQQRSTGKPEWEYAEIRVSWMDAGGESPVSSISCPRMGISGSGKPKTAADYDKFIRDTLAKAPGTGDTIQDRAGSQGWELVTVQRDYGMPESGIRQQNEVYYFKRKK